MIDVFIKYLQEKGNFSPEELDAIVAVTTIKKLRKRQYLLQEGDVWKNNAFVTKGCLKTYSVDDKGNEHILYFAVENWWTGDRESLQTGKPSIYNIEAIEDAEIALISKEKFDSLTANIPAFNNMINVIIQKSFVVAQSRIYTFMGLSAEEKYRFFLQKFPHLPARVPQNMIASFLGITPETLSRVRKQIAKK